MRSSIHANALLVKLSIGMPGKARKDKKMTHQVVHQNKLGENAGRWIKQLYPDEALAPIETVADAFRDWHYDKATLPWPDEGLRILPSSMHEQYCEQARTAKMEFERLQQTHFFAKWKEWIAWAMREHNGQFNPQNYDVAKVQRSFKFLIDFRPVPDSDHYVDSISTLLGADARSLDNTVAEAVKEAMADVWQKLVGPVKSLAHFGKAKELSPDNAVKLVKNIREIIDLVPRLNLQQDPALEQFRREITEELSAIPAEALTGDAQLRAATAAKADAIAKKMAAYMAVA
jgi:hypothetical protein